jgi:hypothetical protein
VRSWHVCSAGKATKKNSCAARLNSLSFIFFKKRKGGGLTLFLYDKTKKKGNSLTHTLCRQQKKKGGALTSLQTIHPNRQPVME